MIGVECWINNLHTKSIRSRFLAGKNLAPFAVPQQPKKAAPPPSSQNTAPRASSRSGTCAGRGSSYVAGLFQLSSSILSTARKASVGICTLPRLRIRFLPSFCFSRSFFFRVMSPP